jgi:hypothetical protein
MNEGLPSRAGARGRSEQTEQPTGVAGADRGRLQPGVVEEVAVAADDRLGTGTACQSDEVVVLGVAQNRVNLGWIIHDGPGFGDARDDFIDGTLADTLQEVGLSQRIGDLAQQLRADDQLEARPRKFAVEQTRRALTVRVNASRHERVGIDDEPPQPSGRP